MFNDSSKRSLASYSIRFVMLILILAFTQKETVPFTSLIEVENKFAKMSVDQSIVESFCANLSDSSIVFENGMPVFGLPHWKSRKPVNKYLFWWPEAADVANSGELGYTTGPYEWGSDKSTRIAMGGGYYSSVWKKNRMGEWKIAIDLGSGIYKPGSRTPGPIKVDHPVTEPPGYFIDKPQLKNILSIDEAYNSILSNENKSYLKDRLSTEIRLYRMDAPVMITLDSVPNEYGSVPSCNYEFRQSGGEVAVSGEFAFTYGLVNETKFNNFRDSLMKMNYLRIWKYEKVRGWRIVLDVNG